MLNNRWVRLAVPFGVFALVVAAGIWDAYQPWTANHFGYALPAKDGLPAYIYANGRRYQSPQVCAGAGWCESNRDLEGIPRCYAQADLERFHAWPLVKFGEMTTVFGGAQPIFVPSGAYGLTSPFVMADGAGCYVMYTLEGGP